MRSTDISCTASTGTVPSISTVVSISTVAATSVPVPTPSTRLQQ